MTIMSDSLNLYRGEYRLFIERIYDKRPLNEYFTYSERHHIIPRCLGGTDDEENLIYLTYREHFIAHKLLAEENPDNKSLLYAYWRMCNGNHECSPEEYAKARKSVSDIRRGTPSPVKGKKFSEEFCRHVSENHADFSGSNHPMYGRCHTKESKKKMSESHKGQPAYNRGTTLSEETRFKISRSLLGNTNKLGTKISEETKIKLSQMNRGENHPMYGKHHTEEAILHMKEGHKNIQYHLLCKSCGKEFIGHASRLKYCIVCKEKSN